MHQNHSSCYSEFAGIDANPRPIPDITIANMPKSHLSFSQDGSARVAKPYSILPGRTASLQDQAGPSSSSLSSSTSGDRGSSSKGKGKGKGKAAERAPELDNRPYEREISRKEKAAVSGFLSFTSLALYMKDVLEVELSRCGSGSLDFHSDNSYPAKPMFPSFGHHYPAQRRNCFPR